MNVDVVDTLALDPALLLIVVGSFMFLITFFGCFGALRNSAPLLKTVPVLWVADRPLLGSAHSKLRF